MIDTYDNNSYPQCELMTCYIQFILLVTPAELQTDFLTDAPIKPYSKAVIRFKTSWMVKTSAYLWLLALALFMI